MLSPPECFLENVAAPLAPLRKVALPKIRRAVPSVQLLEATQVAMVDAEKFRKACITDRSQERAIRLRLEGVGAVRQPRRAHHPREDFPGSFKHGGTSG
eukprot:4346060-Alexandrium_andersonii.AAC.1